VRAGNARGSSGRIRLSATLILAGAAASGCIEGYAQRTAREDPCFALHVETKPEMQRFRQAIDSQDRAHGREVYELPPEDDTVRLHQACTDQSSGVRYEWPWEARYRYWNFGLILVLLGFAVPIIRGAARRSAQEVPDSERPRTVRPATTVPAEPVTDADGEPVEVQCPFCSEKILSTAKKCRHCGEWLNSAADNQSATGTEQSPLGTDQRGINWGTTETNLRILGFLLLLVLLGGVAGMLYGFNMSAAVDTPLGAFNNSGLLNDKQNTIIISGVISLLAAIFLGAILLRASRNRRS
jgi:hypothetical protein